MNLRPVGFIGFSLLAYNGGLFETTAALSVMYGPASTPVVKEVAFDLKALDDRAKQIADTEIKDEKSRLLNKPGFRP